MFVRRALLALLVVLVACGQPSTRVSFTAGPSEAALPAAVSPALDAPLQWAVAVDVNLRLARWYTQAQRSERALVVSYHPPARPAAHSPKPVTPSRYGHGSHRGYATAKECVAMTENGGSYARGSNPSHFGRYQFSVATWVAYGGSRGTWGNASASEQDAVFERAWNSPGGPSNWLPYDGC